MREVRIMQSRRASRPPVTAWPAAVALAGGVGLFLLATAEFKHALSIGSLRSRLLAALAVLATIPLGTAGNAGLQLVSVVGVVTAMLVIDGRIGATRPISARGFGLRGCE